jgi:hypothetical protein
MTAAFNLFETRGHIGWASCPSESNSRGLEFEIGTGQEPILQIRGNAS